MATSPNYGWLEPDNTDLVKNGALAIRTLGNAIDTTMATMTPKSIVDAKGDLIAASAADTPARLAVGNNGETLVADSSTATGLRYQTGVSTNSIINGGMDIWQRGTTFTNPTVANYTADRFMINRSGDASGATVSRTTSAPTGFLYAMQWQRTAGNTGTQSMEIYYGLESNDSYRFAGQTATLSFYAKKGANYSGGNLNFQIASGTGTDAKPYAYTTTVASTSATLTTSYQRFTVTGTFASNITQAFFNISWTPTGTAGADDSVYITGIQLELGSVATTFKRTGGTIQGELAACQRYYQKSYDTNTAPQTNGTNGGLILGATQSNIPHQNYFMTNALKVEMRTAPTVTVYSYTSSTAGVVSDCNGVDKAANSGTAAHIGTRSFNVYNNSGGTITTANGGFVGHYVASAEL